jgi:hypothetical protein
LPTIKRAEADGSIRVARETLEAIAAALKKAGVEFIDENGGGAGVRLKRRGRTKSLRPDQLNASNDT